MIGRLFAHNHKETQQTDIILTLTPHIIRVLDLTEADLRPFRVGRDIGSPLAIELPPPLDCRCRPPAPRPPGQMSPQLRRCSPTVPANRPGRPRRCARRRQ